MCRNVKKRRLTDDTDRKEKSMINDWGGERASRESDYNKNALSTFFQLKIFLFRLTSRLHDTTVTNKPTDAIKQLTTSTNKVMTILRDALTTLSSS